MLQNLKQTVQANQLSYQFPDGEFLFKDISCAVKARRTGLIGRNGAGKSILASLLTKQQQPTSGSVQLNSRVDTFSQLPSEVLDSHINLQQYLDVEEIVYALEQVESGCCEQKWFDVIGDNWSLKNDLTIQLEELGLPNDLQMLCSDLSGGQLSRLQLWKLSMASTG